MVLWANLCMCVFMCVCMCAIVMWIMALSVHRWPWVSRKSLQILIFLQTKQNTDGEKEISFIRKLCLFTRLHSAPSWLPPHISVISSTLTRGGCYHLHFTVTYGAAATTQAVYVCARCFFQHTVWTKMTLLLQLNTSVCGYKCVWWTTFWLRRTFNIDIP